MSQRQNYEYEMIFLRATDMRSLNYVQMVG